MRSGALRNRTARHIAIATGLVAALLVGPMAEPSAAVVRNVDVGDGGCSDISGTPYCSIQAAVDDAGDGDVIQVAAGTYTGTSVYAVDIDDKDLTIVGAGQGSTFIDGENTRPVVALRNDANVTMIDLTIHNGDTSGSGGAITLITAADDLILIDVTIDGNTANASGGGIYMASGAAITLWSTTVTGNTSTTAGGGGIFVGQSGSAEIHDSVIMMNSAGTDGGGIQVGGPNSVLTIVRSTIDDNDADDEGGGIWFDSTGGTLTITDTEITANESVTSGSGGGLWYNSGGATISGTLFYDNHSAADGGGLYQNTSGNLTILNSTFSTNTAAVDGGGLALNSAIVANSTIAGNTAGGVGGGASRGFSSPTARNSIFADNSAGTSDPDCESVVSTDGYNIVENNTCLSTIVNNYPGVDPGLQALADNGGPTRTHAILGGSAAEDAANPAAPGSGGSACEAEDQRGIDRDDGDCDIGAYEIVAKDVVRYAGANRYGTAADISVNDFPTPGDVDTVLIAYGGNFPDALAGAAVAGKLGAPLLLVDADSIPQATLDELHRLEPTTIAVLGGTAVVSDGVKTTLEGLSFTPVVERLAGPNRYATAVEISMYGFPGTADTVVVATGSGFADALPGGPAAVQFGGPVLLTAPNSLPAVVATEIARLAPTRIVVLGGTSAVSAGVVTQLEALAPVVERISGPNRYATSVAISEAAFPAAVRAYVATGLNFPDALAGAAAAGFHGAPVLLVPGTSVPAVVSSEIGRLGPFRVIILGGTAVVSSGVETTLEGLLGI